MTERLSMAIGLLIMGRVIVNTNSKDDGDDKPQPFDFPKHALVHLF